MSGQWPPEWEDPDDAHSDAGLPDAEHPDAGHSDLDLSAVTSFLASVHSPALPASFEARIGAAIAAEAAARATNGPAAATEPAGAPIAAAGAGDAKGTVRSDNPEEFSLGAAAGGPGTSTPRRPRRGSRASRNAAGASGPGNSRPDTRRRRLRMPSTQAASWVLVSCLVLAGFGFLVSRGGSSSSSSPVAASGASSQAAGSAAGPAGQPGDEKPASVPQPGRFSAGASASGPAGFLVYSTGTAYKRSTLVSQVRGQLANSALGSQDPTLPDNSASATAPVPASSASASAASSSVIGGYVPPPQLSGCVSELTDGAAPSLVDEASYDGIPAYIIAVPTEVWVVRRGCTATDAQLIVRVPLKG
jgi:hypothetical protein